MSSAASSTISGWGWRSRWTSRTSARDSTFPSSVPLLEPALTMSGTESRVALVTGGSRGIGRACALALAAGGCDVAVNYRRDADAAGETVRAVEALGRRAVAYQASVDVMEDDEAMAVSVLDDFGA